MHNYLSRLKKRAQSIHIALIHSKAKRLSALFRKPDLKYLEIHLTDHCNLNCAGCGHFCPLAAPRYASLPQYLKDMQRLNELFGNILRIRLMGGEPLLHKDVASFIDGARKTFPRSSIELVTNGILLPKISKEFWDACSRNDALVNITLYPPFVDSVDSWEKLCELHGVKWTVSKLETFSAHQNIKGDSNKQNAFQICRAHFFCPFLYDGHIYTCSLPALAHYFNESFDCKIPADGGINIHAQDVSGRLILRKLALPIESCKWCSDGFETFQWSVSKRSISEWDAGTQKANRLKQCRISIAEAD